MEDTDNNTTEEFAFNGTVNYCDYALDPLTDVLTSTVLPIIVSGGILGIILTVIVLGRKTMCTSTNCYLTSLAFADLLFLVILSSLLLVKKIVGACVFTNNEGYVLFRHYMNIFLNSGHITSVWITVMLAVERYIAICYPLRAMSICTVNRARIVVAVITIFALTCRIPNFWDVTMTWKQTPDDNWHVRWSWNHNAYNVKLHIFIVDCMLSAVVPFLALVILNIRLILEIHKSNRYLRYHLAANSNVQTVISREQFKITSMLLIIIFAFFPCQGPLIFFHAINAYSMQFEFNMFIFGGDVPLSRFLATARILLALKSSLNFVIYCWFSEKFWNTFKRIFCLRYCLPAQLPKRIGKNHTNNSHRPSYLITRETTC